MFPTQNPKKKHAPPPSHPPQQQQPNNNKRQPTCQNRLHDVIHCDKRLYLVFEYLDLDLKKLMDATPAFAQNARLIKVRAQRVCVCLCVWEGRRRRLLGSFCFLGAGPPPLLNLLPS